MDVTFEDENEILIIDAKVYSQNIYGNYEKNMHLTVNLYQIYAHVENKQIKMQGKYNKVN